MNPGDVRKTHLQVQPYHGLLDEIILSVAPVLLGSGAQLLPRNITTPPLKLVDVEKHGDVFVTLTYEMQSIRRDRIGMQR